MAICSFACDWVWTLFILLRGVVNWWMHSSQTSSLLASKEMNFLDYHHLIRYLLFYCRLSIIACKFLEDKEWFKFGVVMTCCHYVILCIYDHIMEFTRQLKQQEKQEKARKLKKKVKSQNVSRWMKNVTRFHKSERMFLEARRTCHVGQNVTRFVKP